MVSDTITKGLKKYAIGSKLRRLRLGKSMGLLELSRHTGLSAGLLSKLERDLMHPTLPTLLRIALVFSVGLEYFFDSESKPVLEIVRKKDRLRFPESPETAQVAYYFESLDFPVHNRALNSYLAEFEPSQPEQCRLHEHTGIEFLYVLSGRLEIRTATDHYELSEGDAIYFDSSVPHGYRRIGAKCTAALVVLLSEGSSVVARPPNERPGMKAPHRERPASLCATETQCVLADQDQRTNPNLNVPRGVRWPPWPASSPSASRQGRWVAW
jgi:transcriptional regulator with XRE-family HTH domain